MFRGMVTPKSARENQIASDLIHDEIFLIEREIKNRSSNNFRSATIDFTVITNQTIPTPKLVTEFDVTEQTLTVISHGLGDEDYVEFFTTGEYPQSLVEGTEYQVLVISDDLIQIYNKRDPNQTPILITDLGNGALTIKRVTTAEQFFKAWDEFYSYEDSLSYIFILENIERHFRNMGFNITRALSPNNKTLWWKIDW